MIHPITAIKINILSADKFNPSPFVSTNIFMPV